MTTRFTWTQKMILCCIIATICPLWEGGSNILYGFAMAAVWELVEMS